MEKTKRRNTSYMLEMLKALIVGLIISLILVLLLAFAIKIFNIATSAIPIINQVIRGVSILITVLFTFRLPKNGWLRGAIFGILYSLLTFVVFSLFDGEFVFGLSLLNDVALGGVTGVISGILAVNLIRRKE